MPTPVRSGFDLAFPMLIKKMANFVLRLKIDDMVCVDYISVSTCWMHLRASTPWVNRWHGVNACFGLVNFGGSDKETHM